MKETLKLGITLLIIAAISAGILAFVNGLTEPIIAQRDLEESTAAFGNLLPDADEFGEIDEGLLEEIIESDSGILEVFEALDSSGDVIGYAVKASAGGYGGQVVIAVGIDSVEDQVAGIEIISHEETPGIGDKIDEDSFKESYSEKSTAGDLSAVDSPAAEDEVQLISGTTVSSKAVVNGANKALEVYRNFLQ